VVGNADSKLPLVTALADRNALAEHVDRELSKPWPVFRGGYPHEVEAALIDAVLSIRNIYGTSPTTGVRGAVRRWREERQVGAGGLDDLSQLAEADALSLAEVLDNRQVLRGGLLKAEGIVVAATRLAAAGVTSAAHVDPKETEHRNAYVGVKGLGPVTWTYLLMLLGHSGVKADTWVIRFVEDGLGRPSTAKEAEALVTAVAAELDVEATTLDHAIWRHMSRRRR